jgi:hypothetical protein
MNATKQVGHTPGPWTLTDQRIRDGGPAIDVLAGPYRVASAPLLARSADNESRLLEVQANARLIAAAPEMLEALREMVARFSEWQGPKEPEDSPAARARNRCVRAYESACAAIAKSEEV